jgi:hypothetical protein
VDDDAILLARPAPARLVAVGAVVTQILDRHYAILASALTKSVEIVTKRPAGSLVSNEAARWASDLQSETKTTKKKLDPVWDLLDDDERLQVLRDVNSKREPELKRGAN